MSKERALLKEVLYVIGEYTEDAQERTEILIAEIEKLLAQPEQEPVAWMNDSGGCFLSDGNKYSENWTALYTAPQKREPLSSIKILELTSKHEYAINLVRAIEKEHGIGGGE
jgi:hypothetical protein